MRYDEAFRCDCVPLLETSGKTFFHSDCFPRRMSGESMASIWEDTRSPHFVACFTAITGMRRVQWKRSTHTEERKLARRIADEIEDAAQGKSDASRVRTLLDGISDLAAKRGLHHVFGIVDGTGQGNREAAQARRQRHQILAETCHAFRHLTV